MLETKLVGDKFEMSTSSYVVAASTGTNIQGMPPTSVEPIKYIFVKIVPSCMVPGNLNNKFPETI